MTKSSRHRTVMNPPKKRKNPRRKKPNGMQKKAQMESIRDRMMTGYGR